MNDRWLGGDLRVNDPAYEGARTQTAATMEHMGTGSMWEEMSDMNYRRAVRCGAITCLMALSVPHVSTAVAESGRDDASDAKSCSGAGAARDDGHREGHDDGHDAGERDAAHEHDSDGEADDDCVIVPPAEVSEAPWALLLPATAVVTGGAAVLIIHRRSKGAHTAKA